MRGMCPALLAIIACLAAEAAGESMVGCYPCDSLVRRYWQDDGSLWARRDSIESLREHGFNWLRLGVTTQSHGELREESDWSRVPWEGGYWSCQEMAERALREASEAGMKLHLFMFLSDTAAHGGQQFPPEAWADADALSMCAAIERYCFETVERLRALGLDIEVYEVGNEIERGICGFRPGERVVLPEGVDQLNNIPWMRENVWVAEALMLTAAIRGIKRADPDGKIVLHAATRPAPEDGLVVAFFEAMSEAGVPFDYAGLSYYPWIGYLSSPPNDGWRAELGGWVTGIAALGKPVVICEYSYPNHPPEPLPGMVVSPMPGFPFTPEGQAAWLREFLSWCEASPDVLGSFYFYPDYVWGADAPDGGTEGLFRLEDGEVHPMPALREVGAR